jgi:TonB family protein
MQGADLAARPSRGIWAFAAVAALALHLGGVALALANLNDTDSDDDGGAPGLVIGLDLAAPRAEPTDLPAGPDSEASPASAAQAEQKVAEKQTELPKETPQDVADPDRLVAPKPPEETPPDKPAVQAMASREAAATDASAVPTSPVATQSDQSVTQVQGLGAAKEQIRATWQKQLVAHLDRHKRYPADREQQAAAIVVAFSIDRLGHLLSSKIVKSSGDVSFDEAALSMLKRSDPLPPPPPLVADDGLSFTVPVIFRVKGRS